MAKIANEGRYMTKCQVCSENGECDYVKYVFHGFEIMYMVCMPCFSIVHLSGLLSLRADIDAFKDQLKLPKLGDDDETEAND